MWKSNIPANQWRIRNELVTQTKSTYKKLQNSKELKR